MTLPLSFSPTSCLDLGSFCINRQSKGATNTICLKQYMTYDSSSSGTPVGARGFKSRMCPLYPHACRKRLALSAKNIKVINSFYKGMHDMQRCLRL